MCTFCACTLALMPQSHPKSGQLSWNESNLSQSHSRIKSQSESTFENQRCEDFANLHEPDRSWPCAGAPDANLKWSGLRWLILRKSTMVLILIDINDISMVGLNLRVCFLLFFYVFVCGQFRYSERSKGKQRLRYIQIC